MAQIAAQERPTLVLTGLVRFSFPQLHKAKAVAGGGGDPKFSLCILIPKTDTATLQKIKKAIDAATEIGISDKWKGKKPAPLKIPLRDPAKEGKEGDEFKGMYFINCSSKNKPELVDRNRDMIFDEQTPKPGDWGRVQINFYPFNNEGSKGIAAGLNAVQFLKEGERLGLGRQSADEVFDDGFTFDDDNDQDNDPFGD